MSIIEDIDFVASAIEKLTTAITDHKIHYFSGPIYRDITPSTHAKLMFRIKKLDKSLDDLEFIGSGSLGQVFGIDGKKVIKVTKDASEAQASIKLINKHNDAIADIYDVFKMKTKRDDFLFCIVQERLVKPDPEWKFVAELWWYYRTVVTHFEMPITARNAAGYFKYAEAEAVKQKKSLPAGWKEWFLKVAGELAANKIKFRDLHPNNIMKRSNGDHVIIDLGVSRSPRSNVPMVARRVYT